MRLLTLGAFLLAAAALVGAGAAHAQAPAPVVVRPGVATTPTERAACTRVAETLPTVALAVNFPDPFVFCADGRLYAVATNSAQASVPVAVSDDLSGWTLSSTDALEVPPAWAVAPGGTESRDLWAPEVIRIGGRYVMYFSARHATELLPESPDGAWKRRNRECIGAAVSDFPDHGYRAEPQPLLCGEFEEGIIDPSPFRDDDGRLYLHFKSDGNCCRRPTGIQAVELSADGLTAVTPPRALGVTNDRDWEGQVVEAPTLVKHAGRYVLFYSGSAYYTSSYGIGYAVCAGPLGPCDKPPAGEERVLSTGAGLNGPGHQSVFTIGARTFIAHHALAPGTPRDSTVQRWLHVEELVWDPDGRPRVLLPDSPAG